MKTSTLIGRSLRHYWRTNLAVLAGVIAATAVVGGALIVGDSVRDSLRQMTLDRLGGLDHALVAQRFFRQELSESLATAVEVKGIPAIIVQAGVMRESDDQIQRAAGVSVYAATETLWDTWRDYGAADPLAGPGTDEVVINRRLAAALGATVGDDVSLLIEIPAAIPRDALLGDRNETVTELPLRISAIAEDETPPGRFGLNPAQQLPLNAFVNLQTLQRQLGMQHVPASRRNPREKPARINAILVDGDRVPAASLNQRLEKLMTLKDLSLRLVVQDESGYVALESDQMILDDRTASAAADVAGEMQLVTAPVLVYLLDEIHHRDNADRFSMYSVVAGIEFDSPSPFGPLQFAVGGPPAASDEVVINEWLAQDLGINTPGEQISIIHKVVGDRGELPDVERTWTVSGILALEGPAADPHFTPYVEGITDADTFGDWRQPYPMDLDRVTERDEDYWDEHSTTPKLFLDLEAAQDLFASRYGGLTSFRFASRGERATPEVAGEFERQLLDALASRQATGLVFQPVREQGLAAASGTSDFTGLFIGFSFFLIAAALLLIGLLVRLGLERRVGEFGLLSSIGLSPAAIQRVFLLEIATIVVTGALLGTAAAVGYAWLMIYGLKTWWFGAIGTRFLFVSVHPLSLATGFAVATIMSILTSWWTMRRLRRIAPRLMLSGVFVEPLQAAALFSRGRQSRMVALTCGMLAFILVAASLTGGIPTREAFQGFSWRVVAFFVVGVALLAGSLALLAASLDAGEISRTVSQKLTGMIPLGLRNAARHRGRSVLTASLIASATFVIVAVAAGRRNPAIEEPVRQSGNGGFTLLAEASVPVLYDLNTEGGRLNAGIDVRSPQDEALLETMRVMPFRVRPGEDASCLNLYQTRLPRILGVPQDVLQALSEEDRFRFAETPSDTPWTLLDEPLEAGRIPVLGDMNTLVYSLDKGIGDTLEVPSDVSPATLEVVGMFDGSVFQGMLLMSEENFHRLFPDRAGFAYFLIEIAPSRADELSRLLETQLVDNGFDVTPVAQRLADFLAVQNTYLSTFQTLGGLGLLLGTLGLGTVMLRNVLERRGELALLRAVGFRNTHITKMVLVENAFLLVWGLASGTLSAIVAMAPHLLSTGADVPWLSLGATILGVFVVGMTAALLAVREAVRLPILATLRAE